MEYLRELFCICTQSLFAIMLFGFSAVAESPSSEPIDHRLAALPDLSGDAQNKVNAAVNRFLIRLNPATNRDPGDLGWDCLAASALLEVGENQAVKKLNLIAQLLADKAVISGNKVIGWRYEGKSTNSCPDGGLDAFGDGTCNTIDTVYSFQTGLGIACLARAGVVLKNKGFIDKASQALLYWNNHTLALKPCDDCVYYTYSNSSNDIGRYVRNVNVFMAYGAAVLAHATDDFMSIHLASQAMRSELDEKSAGNEGYLGRLDPQWMYHMADSSQNIENHAAALAVLSDQIGLLAGLSEFRDHGFAVWKKWATCDNKRCRVADCKVWGGNASNCQTTLTAAHCAFRKRDSLARSQCEEYLSRVGSVPSFGLWSVIVGGNGQ